LSLKQRSLSHSIRDETVLHMLRREIVETKYASREESVGVDVLDMVAARRMIESAKLVSESAGGEMRHGTLRLKGFE
jgi:hypothetical protein